LQKLKLAVFDKLKWNDEKDSLWKQNHSADRQSIFQLINCSKCCPLAWAHDLSLACHWSRPCQWHSAWTRPRQKLSPASDCWRPVDIFLLQVL